MKFVSYEVKTGKENMQIDNDLLEFAIKEQLTEPIFRLYGWRPACISLGRNQKDDFLNMQLLNRLNIDVVRRLTGGRALLHDDEITYSYICPVSSLEHGENVTAISVIRDVNLLVRRNSEKTAIFSSMVLFYMTIIQNS